MSYGLEKACTIEVDSCGRISSEYIRFLERHDQTRRATPEGLGWVSMCLTAHCGASIRIRAGDYQVTLPDSCPIQRLAFDSIPIQAPPATSKG